MDGWISCHHRMLFLGWTKCIESIHWVLHNNFDGWPGSYSVWAQHHVQQTVVMPFISLMVLVNIVFKMVSIVFCVLNLRSYPGIMCHASCWYRKCCVFRPLSDKTVVLHCKNYVGVTQNVAPRNINCWDHILHSELHSTQSSNTIKYTWYTW